MSNSGGGGQAILDQAAGGLTLTNVNNTIQGTGTIGFNGLTVVNEATINANVIGPDLALSKHVGRPHQHWHTGSQRRRHPEYRRCHGQQHRRRQYHGQRRQHRDLDRQHRHPRRDAEQQRQAFFGTPDGNSAILDGSTGAGAITLNGTYTNGVGSSTEILGTINNNNNFQLNAGGGANSVLCDRHQLDAAGRRHGDHVQFRRRRPRHPRPGSGWLDPDQRKQHHPGDRHHRVQRLDGGQ